MRTIDPHRMSVGDEVYLPFMGALYKVTIQALKIYPAPCKANDKIMATYTLHRQEFHSWLVPYKDYHLDKPRSKRLYKTNVDVPTIEAELGFLRGKFPFSTFGYEEAGEGMGYNITVKIGEDEPAGHNMIMTLTQFQATYLNLGYWCC